MPNKTELALVPVTAAKGELGKAPSAKAKQPQVSLEKHHLKKRPMCLEKHQHLPRPSLEKPSLQKCKEAWKSWQGGPWKW